MELSSYISADFHQVNKKMGFILNNNSPIFQCKRSLIGNETSKKIAFLQKKLINSLLMSDQNHTFLYKDKNINLFNKN